MKKIIAMALGTLVILSLAACAAKADPVPTVDPAPLATTEATDGAQNDPAQETTAATTAEDTSAKSGWDQEGDNWLFYQEGTKLTGWLNYADAWYYLNEQGIMQTGWLLYGEDWYFLDGNGKMVTGSLTIGETVYNFNENGICQNP